MHQQRMMHSDLILIVVFFVTKTATMQVGVIYNASMITNHNPSKMNTSTCHECLCTMLHSSQNISILSLNCHVISINAVNCELFTMANYLNSSSFHIKRTSNSTYYFRQLPANSQFIPMETTMENSLPGKIVAKIAVLAQGIGVIENHR